MNLHEYQAQQLFQEYAIPVSLGALAYSVQEAVQKATAQSHHGWVIKAQVHAGGRGKAGGVKTTNTLAGVEAIAKNMLGKRLITQQSKPHGQPVNCVLVQQKVDISRELYLSLVIDRASKKIAIIASAQGGVDIEELAASNAEKIHTVLLEQLTGLQNDHIKVIADAFILTEQQQGQLARILQSLYNLFLDKDLSMIEINPLIINGCGDLLCLDAKISVDDNALYRQEKLAACYDPTQEDPKEVQARASKLNYIALDGNIACMVNGAGLAMATMDIITFYGGKPANFLDVGGNTTPDKVAEACILLFSDVRVKAMLINIFGGIVRCDLIVQGVILAIKKTGINMPIIMRIAGANVAEGKAILQQQQLANIRIIDDLAVATAEVVASVAKVV